MIIKYKISFQFKNYLHESSVAPRILQFTEGGVC